jgi:DinB superfamily
MMHPSELLIPGARATLTNGEKIYGDIPAELFSRKPKDSTGEVVRVNHPAFQIGHLSLYFVVMAEMGGKPNHVPPVPASYQELFKQGADCFDDPEGSVYPRRDAILDYFRSASEALLAVLPEIPPSLFHAPPEDARRKERFKTVGAFFAYLLLSHPSAHFGQIHVWRRMMELP